jgi:hypothetical protein
MEIRITWYTDDLRSQVIDLFAQEYGVDRASFGNLFEQFYLHSFQKNKCLLVVAMDGNTVAGFQSFFYWPYFFNGRKYNSFQSGNSLVNPTYRGQGIFNRMLAFVDEEKKTSDIDFLMGFPVEASRKNFLKDKWNNILDLRWYVRLCNPFGFFGLKSGRDLKEGCLYFEKQNSFSNSFSLSNEKEFTGWRSNYLAGTYFSFHYKEGTDEIIFHLKPNKRKKILNELVIGNVLFNSTAAKAKLSSALSKLNATARKSFGVHFISIAINDASSVDLRSDLLSAGFKHTDRKIFFIVKNFKAESAVLDPHAWLLFRSDIDTW